MSLYLKNIELVRNGYCLVRNLNLKISSQKCVWLKGSNGSGKTTFLEFLAGLYLPESGLIINPNNYSFFFISTKLPLNSKITVKEHIDFL